MSYIDIHFGLEWSKVDPTRQTVFLYDAVSKELSYDLELIRESRTLLRATRAINFMPGLQLKVLKDGQLFTQPQKVRLRLLDDYTKKPSSSMKCPHCEKYASIQESRPFQLERDEDGYYFILEGAIEFQCLQISCGSSSRGHSGLFVIEAEFINPGPLEGKRVRTVPIMVESKTPHQLRQNSYEGVKELTELLNNMGLTRYLTLFIKHEFNVFTILNMEEHHLILLDIEPEHRKLIWNRIQAYKLRADENDITASPDTCLEYISKQLDMGIFD